MYLGASTIKWCHTIKYLGVTLLSGPHMKVDIDVLKRKFFASCNCKGQTELVRLSLVESYCLPILQYCCAAYKLSVVQTSVLRYVPSNGRSPLPPGCYG